MPKARSQVRKQDQALIDQFIAWGGSVQHLRPKTLASYRTELQHLSRAKGPLLRVETPDLTDYDHQRSGGNATRRRRYAGLNRFFGYLVTARLRKDNPMEGLKPPSVSKPVPAPVTDLAGSLRKLPFHSRTAAEFILETGLRLGELESITVRGPIGSKVRVVGRGGKQRVIDLSPRARLLLERIGGRMPMRPRTLEDHLRKVGLAPEVLRAHSLRTAPVALHQRLERRVRRLIEHQEGEEAVFAAYREVEIRVREMAGAPPELIGVSLMRSAFGERGALTYPGATGGEQQATSDLFAGAIGSFKSPSSHRHVSRPAAEVREVLTLANLLMRMLDAVEARLSQSP